MLKLAGTEVSKRRYELMVAVTGYKGLGWSGDEFDDKELRRTRDELEATSRYREARAGDLLRGARAQRPAMLLYLLTHERRCYIATDKTLRPLDQPVRQRHQIGQHILVAVDEPRLELVPVVGQPRHATRPRAGSANLIRSLE